MDSLLRELRHAVRRLSRTPGFTLAVLLTLALGLGANIALFSVVDAVLLRPLPYRDPERLITIFHYYPSLHHLEAPVSVPGFHDYHGRTDLFDGVAVETPWSVNLTGVAEPERLNGARVSGELFRTLGVAAALGRALVPGEDAPGHDHVVVLSDGLWRSRFGGEREVIGRKILLDGEPYDVVGVMPPTFRDPWQRDVDLWVPLTLDPALFNPANYTNEWLALTARLRPGVTLGRAAQALRALAEQLKRDYPQEFPPQWTLRVKSLMEVRTGSVRQTLLLLLGAVGFVLLIACANVANLMLARATARAKEVAIRTALGAAPRVLARQLLTESLVLSVGGGAVGLLVADWGIRSLVAIAPGNLPRAETITIDGRVLLFGLLLSLGTGILFGLAPIVRIARADLQAILKAGGRGATAERGGSVLRRLLVVGEVALALTLLTGAGLLIRSFARLQGVDPGFDPRHVLTFNLALPSARYPSDTARAAFFDAVRAQLAALPGVQAVGATTVLPFSGNWSTGGFNVEGYTPPPNASAPWGDIRIVTPGYLEALRIPLRAGRTFTERDRDRALPVAVVDDEFVHRFYKPGDTPIGRRIWFGSSMPGDTTRYITIVGVVGHTKHEGLDAEARPQLYLPYAQTIGTNTAIRQLSFAVRVTGDPFRVVNVARTVVQGVDRDQPLARVQTLEAMVDASLGQRRLAMALLGLFAGLALLLASVGIYGVMSYTVTQRTREMGLRIALGAARERVLALVLRQGMTLALTGVVVGVAGALALTRLLTSQLYGVRPSDPLTLGVVACVLAGVALLATIVPALRATRVDPIITLREE